MCTLQSAQQHRLVIGRPEKPTKENKLWMHLTPFFYACFGVFGWDLVKSHLYCSISSVSDGFPSFSVVPCTFVYCSIFVNCSIFVYCSIYPFLQCITFLALSILPGSAICHCWCRPHNALNARVNGTMTMDEKAHSGKLRPQENKRKWFVKPVKYWCAERWREH